MPPRLSRPRIHKKLIEVWEKLNDRNIIEYCAACQKNFSRTPEKLLCNTKKGCPNQPPKLLTENIDAWELWNACATQWRASAFGPLGLDYSIVFKMAEFLEITIDNDMMQKIKALEYAYLKNCLPKEGANNAG